MKYSDIFKEIELPRVLTDGELNYYYKMFKEGDMDARNILIEHNIRLVLMVIQRKFNDTSYEFEEMFSIGVIGLIKAIDTFDIDKNKKISTYVFKCIKNEILMYFRKNNKYVDIISLETPILSDLDNPISLGELLEDDVDLEEDYIQLELRRRLVNFIKSILNDREVKVVMMYFGFSDGVEYCQEEISRMLNITRPNVSRILKRSLKKIEKWILVSEEGMDIVRVIGYFSSMFSSFENSYEKSDYNRKLMK